MASPEEMAASMIATLAGYAAWTALWIGGHVVIFEEAGDAIGRGEHYTATGPLIGVLVWSVLCSVGAGQVCAALARDRSEQALLATAILLLVTGVLISSGIWGLMPVWYHLGFLVLLVPVVRASGRAQRTLRQRLSERVGPVK